MDVSDLVGTIAPLLCALLVCALGVIMIVTGNPSLLHSYPYATTPPEELPALARETGACLVVMGLAVGLMMLAQAWAVVVGVVLLVASIGGMFASIVRHNGALVSFGGGSSGAAAGPWGRTVAAVILGLTAAVVLVVTAVPAAQMIVAGDPGALHSYHYANVDPRDMGAFCAWEGATMLAMGAGGAIACMGGLLLGLGRARRAGKVLCALGGVLFAGGMVGMVLVIEHFNGSLMG